MPDPEEMKGNRLMVFDGLEIQQGDLRSVMKKRRFKAEFDGRFILGFSRKFLISEYTIELDVYDMDLDDGFDSPVMLHEFRIYNDEYDEYNLIELNRLPKTLFATLMGYGEELKRRAVKE